MNRFKTLPTSAISKLNLGIVSAIPMAHTVAVPTVSSSLTTESLSLNQSFRFDESPMHKLNCINSTSRALNICIASQ